MIRNVRNIILSISLQAMLLPLLVVPMNAHAEEPVQPRAEDITTTTPIKHFMFLMQENHSFDNYFGTFPGADGIPEGTCMPIDPVDRSLGCIEPFHMGGVPALDLSHGVQTALDQFNNGDMDGFVSAQEERDDNIHTVMGYYDDRDIPYYWNIAEQFVLFDKFFTSAHGGSVWNHMYWVTGGPGNEKSDTLPALGFDDSIVTIFDRLDDIGVSWKFYVQNYDPTITFRNKPVGPRGTQVIWVPLLNIPRYVDDPRLSSRIVDLQEFYRDLANGTLPAVSFLVPSGASEHPPGSIAAGERLIRTLINQLMLSSAWESSAFVWSYDDWGGWYDHVAPPVVDEFGYGFRVPALLVSPYARKGYVDSTVLDFTSGLRFIEENWGVPPIHERDANANSISSAFDFSQPPRAPVLVGSTRGGKEIELGGQGRVVYLAYGALGVVPMLLLAMVIGFRRAWATQRAWEA